MFILYEVFTSFFLDTAAAASRSMLPGIQPGNSIVISKLPYGLTLPFSRMRVPDFDLPSRGDVVVLESPYTTEYHIPFVFDLMDFLQFQRLHVDFPFQYGRSWIIRRVIAVPGDRVYVNGGQAYVQIEGEGDFLNESLLQSGEYAQILPEDAFNHPDSLNNYFTNSLSVPDNHVYLLPDNRKLAFGSPSWGPLHISAIRGKVIHTYGSNSSAD